MKKIIIDKILNQDSSITLNNHKFDFVQLNWYECGTKVMRKRSENGLDVCFRLFEQSKQLLHNDLLYVDDSTALFVEIIPVEVIKISPQSMVEMAKVCYEIGNKHAPLFMNNEDLLLPYDKPMFQWLDDAGFHPSKSFQRLSHAMRSNSSVNNETNHHH